MTPQQLMERIQSDQPTILIDVRDTAEYIRFNVGGNRMTLSQIEANAPKLERIKDTHLAVVSCIYFDSKRVPAAIRRLREMGFQEVEALDGSRNGGGGLLLFSNLFPRFRVPQVLLSNY